MQPTRKTVRVTVAEHFGFQPVSPERFGWSIVINNKVRDIAEDLATEIVTRRARWQDTGQVGEDPLVPGLQEALRRIARQAVWATMQQKKMRTALANRTRQIAVEEGELVHPA